MNDEAVDPDTGTPAAGPPSTGATDALALEAIARTPTMAVIMIDGEGIVRSWSDGGFELLGFRPDDALGRRLADLIVPPTLRRAHEAGLARLRHTGTSDRLGGTFSMPTLHADGSTVVHELTLSAVAVDDEQWYLGVITDQSLSGDRSHAVPSLGVLQEVFERAPEIITVLDDVGRQRTVNRAGARMMGFGDAGRFPGDARAFVHPDDQSSVNAVIGQQIAYGEGIGTPHRYRVLDGGGTWRWLETLLTDVRDIEEIGGFVGFSRDVTTDELRRIELAASVARLSAAVEALPAAAIEDAERRIAHHNSRFSVLVGQDPDSDLRNFDIRPLLRRISRSAVDGGLVDREFARCARSLEATTTDPIRLADERALEVETVPVVQHDEITGRMWTIRDVTDRIRDEQRLRELLAREQDARQLAEERTVLLDQLAEARLRFVSTVSHELRTPLASIMSAVDHLLDIGEPPSDVLNSYLRLVGRNADRLARLVDDLLVVGRLDAGLVELVRVPLDVPAVLREVVADFAPAMAPRSISVALDLQPGPPLEADDLRFREVVENLVENAVKFGPDGGQITVACTVDGDDWLVDVVDQGPGVPMEARERVFEPFARLPQTEDHSVPGTGLGLAIVKGFVELHHGSVRVIDTESGTHIRCQFPVTAGA
jgi:PAS domain S-box-containing protein